ncbi:hypothetical protein LX32DRAFT_23922 [Colletotrichum zoysiae]|uniref:Uncharacterized protein n=1 Tax=Colletotrichum zoysiae TaxID=1216348 RepID=A0AAD9HTX6_9PEZI|nr:hypothetical protein LX32DRAFT_23922 [Colletotrichum zoysiae]
MPLTVESNRAGPISTSSCPPLAVTTSEPSPVPRSEWKATSPLDPRAASFGDHGHDWELSQLLLLLISETTGKEKRGACLRPVHVRYASKDICARALRVAVRQDAPIEHRVAAIGRVILLGISTVLAAINTLLLFDLPSAYAQECRSSLSCF